MSKTVVPWTRHALPAGTFRAVCNQPTRWEPAPTELVEAWRTHRAKPIPYGQPPSVVEAHRAETARLEAALAEWSGQHPDTYEWGRWAGCGLETTDRAEFERHMAEVHGKKPDGWRKGHVSVGALAGRGFRWLSRNDLEKQTGAEISWQQTIETDETYLDEDLGVRLPIKKTIERTGTVWAAAPRARCVWVVPDEPIVDQLERGIRREQLACVELAKLGPNRATAETAWYETVPYEATGAS